MYVAEISIIIKINSKMKRIGAQPVHLAKNKKKEKENISVLYEQPIDKENIDYDLMVFQESLKLNKHQHNQTFQDKPEKGTNKQPLVESVQFMSNTMKMPKKSVGRYDLKDNYHNSLAAATPSTQRLEFSKDWQHFKNIHKTTACFKPVLTNQKVGRGNHSDNILNIICLRSKRGSVEGQLTKTQDQNAKKYSSIPAQDAKCDHSVYQQRIQLMKKAYQAKMSEMQSENKSLCQKNQELRQKADLKQDQRRQIVSRMQAIQKQFYLLQNQNQQIKAIETELNQFSNKTPATYDCFTQTNDCSEYLKLSQLPESIQHVRSSLELSNQTWFSKAKHFKSELQRQKIHASNLQAQFKVTLDNKEIQWRQRYERLEKQFIALNDKYQSKCVEVRDKENLLSRFLVSK